jgi:serine/threonine protein kinase
MALVPLTGLFAERYMIERELGHGATAVVYLAHDKKHDRQIALKVLSKDLAHALGPQRFLQEIHLTARLHHPHILPIFDSGEWNGMLYYVLPFVRGESLRQKIDRENQLPIEECVRITCEVADALSHAHSQGIIHRDVKPENIMLSDGHALLADFGIARALDVHTGERLTSSGLIVGTSAYMSPEQAAGEEKIDARSDIYSLACVLYEMIAGVQAFTGPTTQSVIAQRFKHTPRPVSTYRPQVPEYVEQALSKALAIAPADRYAKMKDFADDLTDTPKEIRDRRRSPLRRAIHGRQKAFGFAAAALVLITAAAMIANPPGHWSSLFTRHLALDSLKYIVIPSPSQGHSDIGAKDIDVATRIGRELQRWNGLKVEDASVVTDLVAKKPALQSGDAFDLAKQYGAGRLIRVNWDGDATVYDVATSNALNAVSSDDVKNAADRYSATALMLLAEKERPKAADGGDGRTNSYAAWSAYGRAHSAFARGDYLASQRGFAAALAADENFAPARLWSAQLSDWLQLGSPEDLADEEIRVGAAAASLASRDRELALALGALGRKEFPRACESYRAVITADSNDVAGWLGLGECQYQDRMVIPWRSSPSTFRFRSSYASAINAFLRAVQVDSHAYDLVGFDRMKKMMPVRSSTYRIGKDSLDNLYLAYPSLVSDTLAYVPYPQIAFQSLPLFARATRRAAVDQNLVELQRFAGNWVRAVPRSSQGYEAFAYALEARGQIDENTRAGISASEAISRALTLSTLPVQRVRLTATEIRLRVKRGDYTSARTLADSLLKTDQPNDLAIADEMVGVAAAFGRIAQTARFNSVPSEVRRVTIPPQVSQVAAAYLAHAALGDCTAATDKIENQLTTRISSYFAEKERGIVEPQLMSRSLSLAAPCSRGSSALKIRTPDALAKAQQALAKGELTTVKRYFDSTVLARREFRPSDLSLDYAFQEAWLRSAAGDTAGAMRQLDEALDAIPSISSGSFRDVAGAGAFGRMMTLRADLASATGDQTKARRYAKAVSELWAEADSELQLVLVRMRRMAVTGK